MDNKREKDCWPEELPSPSVSFQGKALQEFLSFSMLNKQSLAPSRMVSITTCISDPPTKQEVTKNTLLLLGTDVQLQKDFCLLPLDWERKHIWNDRFRHKHQSSTLLKKKCFQGLLLIVFLTGSYFAFEQELRGNLHQVSNSQASWAKGKRLFNSLLPWHNPAFHSFFNEPTIHKSMRQWKLKYRTREWIFYNLFVYTYLGDSEILWVGRVRVFCLSLSLCKRNWHKRGRILGMEDYVGGHMESESILDLVPP